MGMFQYEAPDMDQKAWASLLGLLSWLDFFVTVDQSVLWQRHVAWAKPAGGELRQYVTQRFSSNMVVCSLMISAKIGVFFNSSIETTEMRQLLGKAAYHHLKYWIGIIIALDCTVTVMGLVATFTLWGMISSISDANAHALLRSTIGQYVICLPPRFIVSSIYLFLAWLLLFFIDLIKGPFMIIIAFVVLFLFFQVVIPLSAFGRLIIHTGAMAKRRVLEEEFEKELLPSGLHASLLIRATDRRRRHATDIHQFQQKRVKRVQSERTLTESTRPETFSHSNSAMSSGERDRMDSAMENQIRETARLLTGESDQGKKNKKKGHRRVVSTDTAASADLHFPRASVLNATISGDLGDIVERALSSREPSTKDDSFSDSYLYEFSPLVKPKEVPIEKDRTVPPRPPPPPPPPSSSLPRSPPTTISFADSTKLSSSDQRKSPSKSELPQSRPPRRNSLRLSDISRESFVKTNGRQSGLFGSSKRMIEEWEEEDEVRDLYDLSPPARLLGDLDTKESWSERSSSSKPRPSMLNKAMGLASLSRLVVNLSLDSPDSSVGGDDIDESAEEQSRLETVNEQRNVLQSAADITCAFGSDDESKRGERDYLLSRGDTEAHPNYGKSN